jgi:DNA-binding CsgD family transcriptional regulator
MPSKSVEAIKSAALAATNLEQYLSKVEQILSESLGAVEFKIASFNEQTHTLNFYPRSFDLHTPGLTGQISNLDNPIVKAAINKEPVYLQGSEFIYRAFGEQSRIWFDELLMDQIWIVPGSGAEVLVGYTNELTRLTDSDKSALNLIIDYEPKKSELVDHAQLHAEQQLLTKRQFQVLEYLAEALTNKQIAKVMEISESTVKQETMHIYSALQVKTRTEAVKHYFKNYLIK